MEPRKGLSEDERSEIASLLYDARAILDVITFAGDSPSDLNGSSISQVALIGRERIDEALEILKP
jgi:hypothetical protein